MGGLPVGLFILIGVIIAFGAGVAVGLFFRFN